MKSLLKYYGGKYRIASKIVSYFPDHSLYVEPFAGGLAVLFAKHRPVSTRYRDYIEVINDLDDHLIHFYRVLQNAKRNDLIDKLEVTLYSRSEYDCAQKILENYTMCNDVDRAWAYFVAINQAFSGVYKGGWSYSPQYNNAMAWENRTSRLSMFMHRLAGVHIEKGDAIELIKRWDRPGALFYCDPPYLGAKQNYAYGYTVDQYTELLEVLSGLQGSVVLSGYDNEYVPSTWPVVELEVLTQAKRHDESDTRETMQRTECLWIVDRSVGEQASTQMSLF